MAFTIQIKRADTWPATYILEDGEFGYDKALNILKIGDGYTQWSKLSAIQGGGSGFNGRSIIEIKQTSKVNLEATYTIYYTDGTQSTFVVRDGAKGEQGAQGLKGDAGIGIVSTSINTGGELIISYSDGTSVTLGKIVYTEELSKISKLEIVLRDILTAIQKGGTTANTISEIEQLLVSYFENQIVTEVESE